MQHKEKHRHIKKEDFNSWSEVFRYLYRESQRTTKLNPDIIVPTDELPDPENASWDFSSANLLSLNQGACYVYRGDRAKESMQVRIYKDGNVGATGNEYDESVYHIELDGHNPKAGPTDALKHLFEDVIGIPA